MRGGALPLASDADSAEFGSPAADLPNSWGQALRWLLPARTAGGRLLAALLRLHLRRPAPVAGSASALADGAQRRPLLPMALPYPASEQYSAVPAGRPEGAPRRRGLRRVAEMWVNRVISVMNLYVAGRKAFDVGAYAACGPTPQQLTLAEHLVEDLEPWLRASPDYSQFTGGRARSRAGRLLAALDCSAYDAVAAPGCNASATHALPVKMERVALPQRAGCCHPEQYLPEPYRAEYLDLDGRELAPHLAGEAPRPCHLVKRSEEVPFGLLLCSRGMAEYVEEAELFRRLGLDRRRLSRKQRQRLLRAGGFFCVLHKDDYDRLIYDRRPRNAAERRFGWARLPNGAMLRHIVLPKGHILRGSSDDLRVYFYCLSQPPGGLERNPAGRPVSGSELRKHGHPTAKPDSTYWFCVGVQGMGDLNAVDVAQLCHEAVLRSHGALPEETVLRYGGLFPLLNVLTGVYIDDKFVGGIVQRKSAAVAAGPDADLVFAGERAYEATEGLEQASEKRVRFETTFKILSLIHISEPTRPY